MESILIDAVRRSSGAQAKRRSAADALSADPEYNHEELVICAT
jgi:hypothetical protein